MNLVRESGRGYDLIPIEDELLTQREIFLEGVVDARSCTALIKQLIVLDRENSTEEITIYINSPGGEVTSGLGLYDTIRMIKAPIRTVCIGTAASMGAILFLAADKREMLPHSKLMIHDPSYNHGDISNKKPHEIQAELDDLNKCKEVLAQIISQRCKKDIEEIYEITAKDSYYSADEAVEFGLATGIVKSI